MFASTALASLRTTWELLNREIRVGDDTQKPAGGTPDDGKWPGEKEGKWSGSGGGERVYEAKGAEKRVAAGDLKPEKSLATSQEDEEDQTYASALSGEHGGRFDDIERSRLALVARGSGRSGDDARSAWIRALFPSGGTRLS